MAIDFEAVRASLPPIRELAGLGHKRVGPCPLHDDHSPSFSVYESGGVERWKCFAGCGQGDVIDLAARLEGIDTIEFVKRLRGNSLTIPSRPPRPPKTPQRTPPDETAETRRAVWVVVAISPRVPTPP
jgi:DNA primase (bacterial type)